MADASSVTCQQIIKLVSDYVEGNLSEGDRKRFETHVRTCEGCTRYLDQMRKTIEIAGTLTEEDLGPVARDDLLRLFRDWSKT
jgi:anti-sigma factor RsiW